MIIHEIFVPQVYSSAVPHEDNNMKKRYLGIIIHEILVPQEHSSAVPQKDFNMKKKLFGYNYT